MIGSEIRLSHRLFNVHKSLVNRMSAALTCDGASNDEDRAAKEAQEVDHLHQA